MQACPAPGGDRVSGGKRIAHKGVEAEPESAARADDDRREHLVRRVHPELDHDDHKDEQVRYEREQHRDAVEGSGVDEEPVRHRRIRTERVHHGYDEAGVHNHACLH